MFIVVDGIDGAGKSTLVRGLAEALQVHDPVITKEPTDLSVWGKTLRYAAANERLSQDLELEYFHRDRIEHINQIILPALTAGKLVISDRYVDSTLAFQTASPKEADRLYKQFLPEIRVPDFSFILDCPVSVGLERIRRSRPSLSAFERPQTLEHALAIYSSRQGPNYHHLDAMLPPEDVLKAALRAIGGARPANVSRPNSRISMWDSAYS